MKFTEALLRIPRFAANFSRLKASQNCIDYLTLLSVYNRRSAAALDAVPKSGFRAKTFSDVY